MAKTKDTPAERLESAIERADQLAKNQEEILDASWELVRRHVVTSKPFTPPESQLLRISGYTDKTLKQAIGTVARLVRLRTLAGTAEDREAAAEAATQAVSQLAADGPGLRQVIAEARSQLAALETTAANTARAVDVQSTAVSELANPDLLLPSRRAEYDRIEDQWNRLTKFPIAELQRQIDLTEAVKVYNVVDAEKSQRAVAYASANAPQVLAPEHLDHPRRIDPLKWEAYLQGRERDDRARLAEIEKLTEAGAGLQDQLAELLAPSVQ